jgi:hypothetical protein
MKEDKEKGKRTRRDKETGRNSKEFNGSMLGST